MANRRHPVEDRCQALQDDYSTNSHICLTMTEVHETVAGAWERAREPGQLLRYVAGIFSRRRGGSAEARGA